MKNYFVLLLLAASLSAQAQTIRGKVYFEKDKTPVQFASVALIHLPDSAMVTGVITLTDGGYMLEKITPGEYFVKASFVGYRSAGKLVVIKDLKSEVTADSIFLAEITTALNEVTITAEKLKGKEMVDRTVYQIPEVISKSSTNGYDILKKVPQVNVDFQNNITLNGSSNFIIQVDGRQRDREFLARLLPSDIQSIEIISNPSGKYEGNIDGVINIILKKEARFGISGNAGLNLKPFNKITSAATGSLDYAVGKITFYLTALSFSQALNLSTTNENRFTSIDSVTRMAGSGGIKVNMSTVNSGFDYYLNDKNNLSFNVSYKPISQNVDLLSNTTLLKNDSPLNTVATLTDNGLRSDEISGSLFYKRSFSKPVEEFTAEASYYIFNSGDNNEFTNTRYPYAGDLILNTFSRVEENTNTRNYFSTKLDYVYPIGLYAKIETGYQLYSQQLEYNFNIDNQEASNLFRYSELRNSLYGGVTFNLKKFGLQALMRVENSRIKADSVTDPAYSCFLPSLNLQYKFSSSHNLKFTYNRRINRPGIYDMNPYFKIGQNYSVSQGNPDLKPDYRDRLQLTYTWNFGSNYFSPYVYDEFFTGKVGFKYSLIQSPVNGSLTTITKPFNLLNGYELGGGVNAMLWYVNINARVYKGHYDEYREGSFSIPSRDYFSWTITSYAFANLDKKKKTTAVLYLSYNGVNLNAQSKTYSIPLYGLGGQRQMKNHTVGIFWLLPFSGTTRFQRTETETAAFTSQNTTSINFSNYIQFSYAYKFNKGRNVKKLDHKVEVESDSKSQAIGR
jgi:outer membrane receptor protein involved in Fe transport